MMNAPLNCFDIGLMYRWMVIVTLCNLNVYTNEAAQIINKTNRKFNNVGDVNTRNTRRSVRNEPYRPKSNTTLAQNFMVRGPRQWESVPHDIRFTDKRTEFKHSMFAYAIAQQGNGGSCSTYWHCLSRQSSVFKQCAARFSVLLLWNVLYITRCMRIRSR